MQRLENFSDFVTLQHMEHSKAIAGRLLKVASELTDLANSMLEGLPEADFPPEAAARMEAGKCLNCERTPEEITVIKRGLCQACYQRAHRLLQANPQKEAALIAAGLYAPARFSQSSTMDAIERVFTQHAETASQNKPKKQGRKKRGQ